MVAIFLLSDVLVTALLGNPGGPGKEPLYCAALGGLIAQPMLLGFWLGLARGPALDRLTLTLACAAAGASAFSLAIAVISQGLPAGVVGLFMVAALGATSLAGGFFRAHRFLLGVLTAPPESAEPTSRPLIAEADAAQTPSASPFEESTPPTERSDALAVARELQFGVGYIVAMTSAVAFLITALRWIGMTIPGIQWPIVLGFGCTFFVYSTLAAFFVMTSILATRHRSLLAVAAVLYTLLAPPLTLPVISAWVGRISSPAALTNLYCYALSLSLTLAVVAAFWRQFGYRLRHGWL